MRFPTRTLVVLALLSAGVARAGRAVPSTASATPSQAEAELCSDSGSRNVMGSSQRFFLPLANSRKPPGP